MPRNRRTGLDPAAVRAWQRIFRDFCATLSAVFLFIYSATHAVALGPALVTALLGAGLTLLGTPWFLRRDEARQNGNDED